jgi:hypothetical protein
MTQQRNRKKARVLLATGALIVVAVAGVSLGLAGGSAEADNGQPIILGAACSGTGTNCATSETSVKSTTPDVTFAADSTSGQAALAGTNTSTGLGTDGVLGTAADIGVEGDGAAIGVDGNSTTGTGVLASSLDGIALNVAGRVQFGLSGVATVAGTATSPKNSVRVRMPIQSAPLPITAKTMMTALLQEDVPGVYVVAAVPNVPGDYFTIYLNKTVTTSVGPIAWMVTERP